MNVWNKKSLLSLISPFFLLISLQGCGTYDVARIELGYSGLYEPSHEEQSNLETRIINDFMAFCYKIGFEPAESVDSLMYCSNKQGRIFRLIGEEDSYVILYQIPYIEEADCEMPNALLSQYQMQFKKYFPKHAQGRYSYRLLEQCQSH